MRAPWNPAAFPIEPFSIEPFSIEPFSTEPFPLEMNRPFISADIRLSRPARYPL